MKVSRCGHALVVSVDGPLVRSDQAEFLRFIESGSGLSDAMPILFDMRRADFLELTSKDVRALVEIRAPHAVRLRGPSVRLVSSSLGFGMMRMYQTLCELRGGASEHQSLVTYSMEEALDWLGIADDAVRSCLLGHLSAAA